MKLLTRGDIDGFCAIALDNIVQLLLVPALCLNVVGMPPALVYGRILPGVASRISSAISSTRGRRTGSRKGRTATTSARCHSA